MPSNASLITDRSVLTITTIKQKHFNQIENTMRDEFLAEEPKVIGRVGTSFVLVTYEPNRLFKLSWSDYVTLLFNDSVLPEDRSKEWKRAQKTAENLPQIFID